MIALSVGCICATPLPRYRSHALAPALTTSSTDARRIGDWNTAGSVGTLARAIAEIRVGDAGDDLGRNRFSLRSQRTGQLGTDVSRGGPPLRAGRRGRSRTRYDVRAPGRIGRPEGVAGGRKRLAGP